MLHPGAHIEAERKTHGAARGESSGRGENAGGLRVKANRLCLEHSERNGDDSLVCVPDFTGCVDAHTAGLPFNRGHDGVEADVEAEVHGVRDGVVAALDAGRAIAPQFVLSLLLPREGVDADARGDGGIETFYKGAGTGAGAVIQVRSEQQELFETLIRQVGCSTHECRHFVERSTTIDKAAVFETHLIAFQFNDRCTRNDVEDLGWIAVHELSPSSAGSIAAESWMVWMRPPTRLRASSRMTRRPAV